MNDAVIPVIVAIATVLLILDLLAAAASSSMNNLLPARLLGKREASKDKQKALEAALDDLPRQKISVRFFFVLMRFGLAAALYGFLDMQSLILPGNAWPVLGWFLAAAVLLAWLEWWAAESAAQDAEGSYLRLMGYIRALTLLAWPLTFIPLAAARRTQNGASEPAPRMTEETLMTMVDAGQQEGVLEQDEREMIYSIIELGETTAREIMVPRIDILALDVETTPDVAIDALLNSGYSRVPVYEDTVDNVIGLLYAKDLLGAWRKNVTGMADGGDDQFNGQSALTGLLRPAYFVPESKKVDELLTEMQARRIHMAIVVDEYGGVAGLVTLEDIVEEIVGEIRDEFDLGEEAYYQEISSGVFLCSGRMQLDDFNELLNVNLPDDDADTLGGYIYSRIGRVPLGGESIVIQGLRLTVEQVAKRRIRTIRVEPLQEGSDEQSPEPTISR